MSILVLLARAPSVHTEGLEGYHRDCAFHMCVPDVPVQGEKGQGTSGKTLHYKGSSFHRIIPQVRLFCKHEETIGGCVALWPGRVGSCHCVTLVAQVLALVHLLLSTGSCLRCWLQHARRLCAVG